jgi:hypothetical protein
MHSVTSPSACSSFKRWLPTFFGKLLVIFLLFVGEEGVSLAEDLLPVVVENVVTDVSQQFSSRCSSNSRAIPAVVDAMMIIVVGERSRNVGLPVLPFHNFEFFA